MKRWAGRVAIAAAITAVAVAAMHAAGMNPRPLPVAAAAAAALVLVSVVVDGEARRAQLSWPAPSRRTRHVGEEPRVRRLQQSIEAGRRDRAAGRMIRESLRSLADDYPTLAARIDVDTAPIATIVSELDAASAASPARLPAPSPNSSPG